MHYQLMTVMEMERWREKIQLYLQCEWNWLMLGCNICSIGNVGVPVQRTIGLFRVVPMTLVVVVFHAQLLMFPVVLMVSC
jgi:hypothetical protein